MRFEKVSYDTFVKSLKNEHFHFTMEELHNYYDRIELPKRATANSAGYDFFCPVPVTVSPGQLRIVPTGIKCRLYESYYLELFVRSSVGIRNGIVLANGTGIIDADYYNNPTNEGQMLMPLINLTGGCVQRFKVGDRIVQGVIGRFYRVTDDNTSTLRNGGVGSTNA